MTTDLALDTLEARGLIRLATAQPELEYLFRHALLLNGSVATSAQCEAMLHAALEACERYYQAFQFVVWAGKQSREALVSTMFETEGQA